MPPPVGQKIASPQQIMAEVRRLLAGVQAQFAEDPDYTAAPPLRTVDPAGCEMGNLTPDVGVVRFFRLRDRVRKGFKASGVAACPGWDATSAHTLGLYTLDVAPSQDRRGAFNGLKTTTWRLKLVAKGSATRARAGPWWYTQFGADIPLDPKKWYAIGVLTTTTSGGALADAVFWESWADTATGAYITFAPGIQHGTAAGTMPASASIDVTDPAFVVPQIVLAAVLPPGASADVADNGMVW